MILQKQQTKTILLHDVLELRKDNREFFWLLSSSVASTLPSSLHFLYNCHGSVTGG